MRKEVRGKWRRLVLAQLAHAACDRSGDPDAELLGEEFDELAELVREVGHAEWVGLPPGALVQFEDEPPQVVMLVATAIERSGELTAAGIRGSAGLLSNCVGCFLHVFKQQVPKMREPAVIPRAAGTVVESARCVATAALGITSCVGESVAAAVAAVGAAAAERVAVVSRQGVASAAVRTLGTASLSALSEVYDAVDISTRQLASSSVVAASDAISHRYGDDAGRVTHDAFAAVGSAAQAAFNFSTFGRKGLAKTAAKSAAKAVVAAAVEGQDDRSPKSLSRAEVDLRTESAESEGWVRLDRAWDLGNHVSCGGDGCDEGLKPAAVAGHAA